MVNFNHQLPHAGQTFKYERIRMGGKYPRNYSSPNSAI